MTAPRTGASKPADVPAEILAQLNAGTLATATLAEGLAIDFAQLLAAVVPEHSLAVSLADKGIAARMQTVAVALLPYMEELLPRLRAHPSDTARGWACYMIGIAPKWKLAARLAALEPLADDPHFGVREWAWLAMRPYVVESVSHFLKAMVPWAKSPRENLRRFASESTRPRGVWSVHVKQLVQNPAPALPLLELLRADSSPYVQNSVGNWLNDAGKSQPAWVREVAGRWRAESACPATDAILRRALRRL